MLLNILTSSSELNIISDFQYLFELARCSKCQMFILLASTNKLYGASDDCSSIHEIDVPFLINTDLEFRVDSVDKELIAKYDSYFIPDKYPWVILPAYYWDMYKGEDLYPQYDSSKNIYYLYDKTTKTPIEQIQMYKCLLKYDYGRANFMNQLDHYFIRLNTLGVPYTFYKMEQHPMIRKAYDSKAAMGRFLCRFTNECIDVALYFYKGIFSLGKSDTLDIDIRFDKYVTNQFMVTYKPKKKKNPISFNRYGVPYSEVIHCMYVNLI